MSIDLRASLRRQKPEKRLGQIALRPRSALVGVADVGADRQAIVLDTNVYILQSAGRLPQPVEHLLKRSLLFHCSACLAELATGIANLDPRRPDWIAVRDHYAALFDAIPASRVLTPDAQIWTDAGLVAGSLARTQGFQRQQLKECLNDSLILLTAAKAGLAVLTANRDEFDLIQQVAPECRFIHF